MRCNLFVPKQAVGANLIYFDLFNATGSTRDLKILMVQPVVSGADAVVGTLGVDLFLQRTSAVGTGGTAATFNGTDPTACTITAVDHSQSLPQGITARISPSGGATAGAVVGWTCVFTEETADATYNNVKDMVRHGYLDLPPLTVPPNSGISVVQGAVASVGNIGFNVVFDMVHK